MSEKNNLFIWLLGILLLGTSCSKFNRIMKNPDAEVRYDAAMAYYEKGDYYRANLLFEDLIPNLMGSAKAEKVQFTFAYCHYYQGQYQLSGNYFKSFYDTYRRSPMAEEALYMYAYSQFKNTPQFNLDQSHTNDAITAMQDFLNKYPKSQYKDEANKVIATLRSRQERKAYEIARLYERLRQYKAAVISFTNFTKDFPDSGYKEDVFFRRLYCQHELARLSMYNVKKERWEKFIEYYQAFIDRYPNSANLREAERLYDTARKELSTLNAQVALK